MERLSGLSRLWIDAHRSKFSPWAPCTVKICCYLLLSGPSFPKKQQQNFQLLKPFYWPFPAVGFTSQVTACIPLLCKSMRRPESVRASCPRNLLRGHTQVEKCLKKRELSLPKEMHPEVEQPSSINEWGPQGHWPRMLSLVGAQK